MNDKRKLLLKKALKNNGRLTTSMASRLYSGSGKDVIASLEFQGYIENVAPGVFKVVKAPEDVKAQVKEELEA